MLSDSPVHSKLPGLFPTTCGSKVLSILHSTRLTSAYLNKWSNTCVHTSYKMQLMCLSLSTTRGQKMSDQQVYSTGAVAEQVQLPSWRLIYLIDSGTLPGSSIQVPGRRIFTSEDLRRIKEILQARPELTEKRTRGKSSRPEGCDLLSPKVYGQFLSVSSWNCLGVEGSVLL